MNSTYIPHVKCSKITVDMDTIFINCKVN